MFALAFGLLAGLTAQQPTVLFVQGTVARVREAPDAKAKVLTTLPIAAEVKVTANEGGWSTVKTNDGVTGHLSSALLGRRAPRIDALMKRGRLSRAVALDPNNLELIERFLGTLKGERVYYGRKGWVAAKRRALSWDGPLYPIDDGRARMSAGCEAHDVEGPNGMGDAKLDDQTRRQRTRAFHFVNSGKVVSVSERGGTTERLERKICEGGQLFYPMKRAARGALVPSWMVAGYEVTPVKGGRARSTRRTVRFDEGTVTAATFSGEATSKLPNDVEPIAVFSGSPSEFMVLVRRGEQALLLRAQIDDGALSLELGRAWGPSGKQGPGGATFKRLPGEPRDISRANLLSDRWKQ